jgi:hypothetical protein
MTFKLMSRTRRLVSLLLAAYVFTPPLHSQQGLDMSSKDMEWFGQARQRSYDVLMPLEPPRWRVVYRSEGDIRDEIEQYFAIRISTRNAEALEAAIVVPTGGAISKQLTDLRKRDPNLAFDSAPKQLTVRQVVVDAISCPILTTRMNALSSVPLTLKDDGFLSVDSTIFRINVETSTATIMTKINDDEHPLVRWATRTYEALLACAKRPAVQAN